MNNFKTVKKFLALVMALLIAFSGVSVYASETENDDYEAAVCHEHLYGDWIIVEGKQPTCQTEGLRYRECKNCTEGKETEIMPADPNAHVPGEEKVIKSATCTSAGISEYTCINEGCKVTYQVETAKLGHSFKEDTNGNVIVEVSIAPKHMYKHYENGKGFSSCIRCGVSVEQIIYVEHDFDGATSDITKPATCTEDGYKETKCNVCQYSIIETIPSDSNAHVFTGKAQLKEGVVFDCNNDGLGVAVCEKCNATSEITIPKEKYHDYLEWEVDTALPENPTCGEYGDRGIEVRICDACNTEIERRIIYAPHNFIKKGDDGKEISQVTGKVASTCCTRGYEVGNCVDCGQKDVKNYYDVDPSVHNYIEKVTKKGSCTEKGEVLRLCVYDASHFEYIDVEIVDHVYIGKWTIKEATCREDGYKKNYCDVCGDVNIVLPKDENAHDFSDRTWDVIEESTCSKNGTALVECRHCGEFIEKPLPLCYSTGANFKTKAPTCYSEGEESYICTVCGQLHKIAIPIDDKAHIPAVRYKVRKVATCTEPGLETKYCDFCNADIQENQKIIPAKPHTVKEVIDVYPECAVNVGDFKKGSKHHECVNCDYKSENSIEILAEHNFTSWENKDTPNCQFPITRERVCYGCGLVEADNNFYGNHVDVKWTFPEGSNTDCTTGGIAVKKCSECNEIYDKKTIAAGNHTDLVFVTDQIVQTDTECYGNVYKCVTCDKDVVITKPHNFIIIQKGYESTCDVEGLTDSRYCGVCKLKQEQAKLPALGHDKAYDSNGTEYCKRCNLYQVKDGLLDSCNHFCHNQGIVAKVLKMVSRFFWKLFGTSRFCKCGAPHYHEAKDKFNNPIVTIHSHKFDAKGKLSEIVYSCTECEVNKEKYEF